MGFSIVIISKCPVNEIIPSHCGNSFNHDQHLPSLALVLVIETAMSPKQIFSVNIFIQIRNILNEVQHLFHNYFRLRSSVQIIKSISVANWWL